MRGRAPLEAGNAVHQSESSERPLIRPASRPTFSRKGRRGPCARLGLLFAGFGGGSFFSSSFGGGRFLSSRSFFSRSFSGGGLFRGGLRRPGPFSSTVPSPAL